MSESGALHHRDRTQTQGEFLKPIWIERQARKDGESAEADVVHEDLSFEPAIAQRNAAGGSKRISRRRLAAAFVGAEPAIRLSLGSISLTPRFTDDNGVGLSGAAEHA